MSVFQSNMADSKYVVLGVVTDPDKKNSDVTVAIKINNLKKTTNVLKQVSCSVGS